MTEWSTDGWEEPQDSGPVRHPDEAGASAEDPGRSTESDGGSETGPPAVPDILDVVAREHADAVEEASVVPDFMRQAMAAAGVDVEAVAAKVVEIEQAGGVDALAISDYGKIIPRSFIEPAERDEYGDNVEPLFDVDAETSEKKPDDGDDLGPRGYDFDPF